MNDIANQIKNFVKKGFENVRNIFRPKLVDSLIAVKEDLSSSLKLQQDQLKLLYGSEIGILSNAQDNIKQFCTDLCEMQVDGHERYRVILDSLSENSNLIETQKHLDMILSFLGTSTTPGEKTPENIDYHKKFTPFFDKIYNNHIDVFPKDSTKRNYLLPSIEKYIDKNDFEDVKILEDIKQSIHYKKNDIIRSVKAEKNFLERKKIENKLTEQNVFFEDYNNKIILFRKGMEEYSKQPGTQILWHEDTNKIIQSLVFTPPKVNITYTTQDKPNETQQREISMKGFTNSFEFKTI